LVPLMGTRVGGGSGTRGTRGLPSARVFPLCSAPLATRRRANGPAGLGANPYEGPLQAESKADQCQSSASMRASASMFVLCPICSSYAPTSTGANANVVTSSTTAIKCTTCTTRTRQLSPLVLLLLLLLLLLRRLPRLLLALIAIAF
jgi:ribosomal protein S27E